MKFMNGVGRVLGVSLLGLGVLVSACGSDDSSRKLSLIDSDEPIDEDAEAERLRKMQMIRVLEHSTGKILDWTPDDFAVKGPVATCHTPYGCSTAGNACDAAACLMEDFYCMGEFYSAAAGVTPGGITFVYGSSTGIYTVLEQSASAKAILASKAANNFRLAMEGVTGLLTSKSVTYGVAPGSPGSTPQTGTCTLTGTAAGPLIDKAGAIFVDSFQQGKDAFDAAVEHTLAVADAELSSTPAFSKKRRRAITQPLYSRMHAAHMLVGGPPGFMASTTKPYCTSGRLSGPGQAALEVFRQAAPAPEDIVNTSYSINVLVNGDASIPQPSSTLKARMASIWGNELPSGQGLQEVFGLELQDFEAARAQLRDEQEIFQRTSATLPKEPGPGGVLPTHYRFAGTASPPPDRDPTYWVTLAMSQAPGTQNYTGNEWSTSYNMSDPPTYPHTPDYYSLFVDYAYTWAGFISQLSTLRTSGDTTFKDRVMTNVLQPLSLLSGGRDRLGRVEYCQAYTSGAYYQKVSVHGYSSNQGLAVVQGDDQLACATTGSVEGAPCTLVRRAIDQSDTPRAGFGAAARTAAALTTAMTKGDRYYVIQPKQSLQVNAPPGEWTALAGFTYYGGSPGGQQPNYYCRFFPIVPDAFARAKEIMEPSRSWCGSSSVSCAGAKFDERMPLEDELSSDGDEIESSWKHYLGLARQAADEADALGQEYLNAGMSQDHYEDELNMRQLAQQEKAAAALEEMQQICGTAIDPEKLLSALGVDANGELNLSLVDTGTSCTAGETLPLGFECRGGKRVKTWIANLGNDPTFADLKTCVSELTAQKTVHLGDSDMCRDPSTGNVRPGCDGCNSPLECIHAEEGLGLVSTETIIAPAPPVDLCNAMQRIREVMHTDTEPAQKTRSTMLKKIVDDPRRPFQTAKVRQMARGLDIHLDYGGYVTVSVGGKSFSTGSPASGASGTWPCGGPVTATPFHQRRWDCADPGQRATANDRLYKAALAGMLLGNAEGDPLPTIEVPAYVNQYVYPQSGERGSVSLNSWLINTMNGSRWRVFETYLQSAIPANDPARLAHSVGATEPPWWLDGVGPGQNKLFAIQRVTLSRNSVPDLVNAIWGGMTAGDSQKGYYRSVLEGIPHADALPKGVTQSKVFLDDLNITYKGGGCSTTACEFSRDVRETMERKLQLARGRNAPGGSDKKILPASEEDSLSGWHMLHLGDVLVQSIPYTAETLLDSFELLCEGTAEISQGCNLENPPSVTSIEDLDDMGEYLECMGDDITNKLAGARYKIPESVASKLNSGGTGADAKGGDMAVAVSELRKALQEVAISGATIGGTIRAFGQDVKGFKAQLSRLEVSSEMVNLQTISQTLDRMTSCYTAMFEAATLDVGKAAGGAASAAVTCANAVAQTAITGKLGSLQQTDIDLQRDQAFADFSVRSLDYSTKLETEQLRTSQALESINTQLEIIEGLRSQAKRAVDKAMWFMSAQSDNQGEILSALSSIEEGSKIRYKVALKNAKRMAFLAKRAIELRLGLSLAEMTEDMTLVAAPSTWESTVCTLSGINYEKLKEDGGDMNFADGFIGDYVDKLEQVVESYRLMHNFHEAKDVAVLSLRDDVMNVRTDCDVESRNLLYYASDLRASGLPDTVDSGQSDPEGEEPVELVGWKRVGCANDTPDPLFPDDPVGRPLPNCINITNTGPVSPFSSAPHFNPRVGQAPILGYSVKFGDGGACPAATCGWRSGAALRQDLLLEPGRYRFSWYTTDPTGTGGAVAGFAKRANGDTIPTVARGTGFVAGVGGDWNRVYMTFDVDQEEIVSVGFQKPALGTSTVTVSGAMLEALRDPLWINSRPEPPPFMDTKGSRLVNLQVCEDSQGEKFREQKWDRQCVRLCKDGYDSICNTNAPQSCYWQTTFHLSQRAIEAGWMLQQSGFAKGNFNYRIDSVAVNFVGTGLRACDDSNLPSTCYAGGFLPYSLSHEGPYYVRNHMGQDYKAALFPGRIEHARGLATERYITNPVSETDRSLLADYTRYELRGRPLDGEFMLRVWDEPSVDFGRIQDVQLVMNYRYWTRFD